MGTFLNWALDHSSMLSRTFIVDECIVLVCCSCRKTVLALKVFAIGFACADRFDELQMH